jgi:hypothetical protein
MDSSVDASVSEKHTISIFRAEVNFTIYVFGTVSTSDFPEVDCLLGCSVV